jgi:hypothetical protein
MGALIGWNLDEPGASLVETSPKGNLARGRRMSHVGTKRTSSDVRNSVAIGGKTGHGAHSPIRSKLTHFGVAVERRFSVQVSPHLAATRLLRLDKPLKRGVS